METPMEQLRRMQADGSFELQVYPEGTLEYGELMKMQGYDDSLRILNAIRGDGKSLVTVQYVDDAINLILDLRNELGVNDESS